MLLFLKYRYIIQTYSLIPDASTSPSISVLSELTQSLHQGYCEYPTAFRHSLFFSMLDSFNKALSLSFALRFMPGRVQYRPPRHPNA